MMASPSKDPIAVKDIDRVADRISFLYVGKAAVNRKDNAITVCDSRGTAHVAAATLAALLLGPGTRISHAAMSLLGDSGASVAWVGEKGTRFYAAGRSSARTSRMAEAQAAIVTHQRRRLACARQMYSMRFAGEDVSTLTMSQLRGREGTRMKRVYAAMAVEYDVPWNGRRYDPKNFYSSDPINQALTSANSALYGITHAVICSLGFIPSLGVVHNGTDRALVYDIADLYKVEISIPAAFAAVSESEVSVSGRVRRRIRDIVVGKRLIPRMVEDLMFLMEVTSEADGIEAQLQLWSELEPVASGVNWATLD